jgi:hypothetical protein
VKVAAFFARIAAALDPEQMQLLEIVKNFHRGVRADGLARRPLYANAAAFGISVPRHRD